MDDTIWSNPNTKRPKRETKLIFAPFYSFDTFTKESIITAANEKVHPVPADSNFIKNPSTVRSRTFPIWKIFRDCTPRIHPLWSVDIVENLGGGWGGGENTSQTVKNGIRSVYARVAPVCSKGVENICRVCRSGVANHPEHLSLHRLANRQPMYVTGNCCLVYVQIFHIAELVRPDPATSSLSRPVDPNPPPQTEANQPPPPMAHRTRNYNA